MGKGITYLEYYANSDRGHIYNVTQDLVKWWISTPKLNTQGTFLWFLAYGQISLPNAPENMTNQYHDIIRFSSCSILCIRAPSNRICQARHTERVVNFPFILFNFCILIPTVTVPTAWNNNIFKRSFTLISIKTVPLSLLHSCTYAYISNSADWFSWN